MSEQMPFIGREKELTKIEQLINDWGTRRVLFIHGEGGVGKTRLLQEIHKQHPNNPRLLVADIIDFDDRAFHIIENVERQIMQNLDTKALETYIRKRLDWHKMKLADVSAEKLNQQHEDVRQILVDNLTKLASEKRIVMPFDTMEKFEGTNIWERLTDIILESKNTLFILSGRENQRLYELLHPQLGEEAVLIKLKPLETKSSRQYLKEKRHLLHIALDPDLERRLLLLAQGRPILIDLAVEWLSHNEPLDEWLIADDQVKDQPPTDEEMKRFQAQLVTPIGKIRKQMERLILLMSRVYPLDVAMISKSLNLAKEEAQTLLKQAQTYVFVKSYPDHRIYLHDEMRRMIQEYVWPDIDPSGGRRQRDSRFAIEYLTSQAETIIRKYEQFGEQEKKARQVEDAQAEFDAFVAREVLEQELWGLREQLLFHTVFVDSQKGVELFIEIFDKATKDYKYSFREVLLRQMRGYIELTKEEIFLDELSPEQIYEVDIRQAKFWLDSGQYAPAENLLKEMSDRSGLRPDQQIDTYIQLANIVIRLGGFQDGIELFKKAVKIGKEHKLKDWLAKAETGLGWAYRLVADFKNAGEHYEVALDLALELEQEAKRDGKLLKQAKHQQGLLYGNLGFLYAYYAHIPGSRDQAMWFCNRSLAIWQELKDKRGQGRAYTTLGRVSFMDGRLNNAMAYFQKALNIFEPANDREWLSLVYSWRGATYFSMHEFDTAEEELHRSLEMNVLKDKPINLSRLGQLYMSQSRWDEAEKSISECRELALELPDVWYQLVSLRDMANLSFYKRAYERLEEFEQMLVDYREQWGESQDLRALGMLYLYFGRLALGRLDLDKTVEYFSIGLKLLVQLGRYGNDTSQFYIQRLEKDMVEELNLSVDQIQTIGSHLLSFWQREGLNIAHRDVRLQLSKWAKWGGI